MSAKKIVMLVDPGTSTRMIYHGLKNKLPIARVVMEDPSPGRSSYNGESKSWAGAKC